MGCRKINRMEAAAVLVHKNDLQASSKWKIKRTKEQCRVKCEIKREMQEVAELRKAQSELQVD